MRYSISLETLFHPNVYDFPWGVKRKLAGFQAKENRIGGGENGLGREPSASGLPRCAAGSGVAGTVIGLAAR